MLSVSLSYIPYAITTVEQIKQDQLSQSPLTRHIQTRVRLMELFLRVAFRAGTELLSAVAKLPFAAVKLLLDRTHLGYLLPVSVSFGGVANHLKRSIRCAALLTLDSPGIFIDPTRARAALLHRELVSVEAQPEPTAFESLLKRAWTPAGITLASAVIAIAVIYRLGLLSPVQTPTPHSDKDTPQPHGDSAKPSSTENSSSTESSLGWKWGIVPIGFTIVAFYARKKYKDHQKWEIEQRRLHKPVTAEQLPKHWSGDNRADYLDYAATHLLTQEDVEGWKNQEVRWASLLQSATEYANETAKPPVELIDKAKDKKARLLYEANPKTRRDVRGWTNKKWMIFLRQLANSPGPVVKVQFDIETSLLQLNSSSSQNCPPTVKKRSLSMGSLVDPP